jgi:tetratricopeptide (TPR) repeat protein
MSYPRLRSGLFCLLLLVLPSPAGADAPSREEQARRHFVAGQAHYHAGRYADSLTEFELGYALAPRPEFLINFAQVHRKLGHYERAIAHCESFLATGPPPRVADEAHRLLASIREEQAQAAIRTRPAEPTPVKPPPPSVEPRPVTPPPATPPPVLAQPAPILVAPPPPAVRPRSRAWIWGVVVAGVVVAGAGIGIALAVSYPTSTYPTTPLDRVSFR